MSRYPTYSYTYSPQPPSLSTLDYYNLFRHDFNDSSSTVNAPKSSPYPSPNPNVYRRSRANSIPTKPHNNVISDEKSADKLTEIPVNSPAIPALPSQPPHYRHNDYECQRGHHAGEGNCPYIYPSTIPFTHPYIQSEYASGDAHKWHHSARFRRILLPVLVMLTIIAGIFALNACLVSGGVIASWGDWDWKGLGEWKTVIQNEGMAGSDTGVIPSAIPQGSVVHQGALSGMSNKGVNEGALPHHALPQTHAKPASLPQQPVQQLDQHGKRADSHSDGESSFVKHKLYLIVIFGGLLVVIILAVMLSAWCCESAFENPCCCPCYLCACCGGLACLECIGCGLCCEGLAELGDS